MLLTLAVLPRVADTKDKELGSREACKAADTLTTGKQHEDFEQFM